MAGLAQATAWLVSAAFLLSRRQPCGHARPPGLLWALWHCQVRGSSCFHYVPNGFALPPIDCACMQVFAAALAVLPRALARASLEAEDAPPVAAAALQLLFVIALDWEQGSRRSAHARQAHLQERLLPAQGAWHDLCLPYCELLACMPPHVHGTLPNVYESVSRLSMQQPFAL